MTADDEFTSHIKYLLMAAAKMHEVTSFEAISGNSVQKIMLQFAFLDARKAYHENRGGDALKALGAFWNIYTGYDCQEEAYKAKAQTLINALNNKPTTKGR